MTDDSIEHIVAERLDRIFGDDDEDEEVRKPAAEAAKSAIDPVRQAAMELENGVRPETVERLTSSIHALGKSHGKDPLFLPLLKMMHLLSGYLSPARQDVNRPALQSVRSVIECMEALEGGRTLPDVEKRKRVQKEIESFKVFREAIRVLKPPEKSPKDARTSIPAAAGHTPAYTAAKGEDATAVPPRPEPQHPKEEPPASIPRIDDLDAFRKSLSTLNHRIEGIRETLDTQAASSAELRDTLSQIGKGVNALIKKTMEKPPHKTEDPGVDSLKAEDIRSCVREAMEEGLKEFRGLPAGLSEVQEAVSDAFTRFEKRINELHEEIRSVQEGLRSIRSEIDDLQTPKPPNEPAVEEPFQVGEAELGMPLEEDERPGPAGEPEDPEYTPPARPGLPTGSYFLFSTGGKNYAVDEQYVVKASEAGGGLQKKARIRGGLTISDSSSSLFKTKKGIEPPWLYITSGEFKRTLFRLVSEGELDGLEHTGGKGVLFLWVGDERIVFFTDHPALKITLGDEDEVHMSGVSGSQSGPFCGSIQRSGEPSGFYMIISPEKIAEPGLTP